MKAHEHAIVITGGHVSPAIAIIDALQKTSHRPLVFIGRKHAIEGSPVLSAEYRLVTGKGIRFVPITAGRLQRHASIHTVPSLLKIPVGFFQALMYCIRERPSLIVSFGGYVALPVAVAGWVCGIPVITHEQTLVAGLANRIIARIAKRVCVAFPETAGHFPEEKAVYTGFPIRGELFTPPAAAPFTFHLARYPLLFVTGGSTGARSLNRAVYPVLLSLLGQYTIVHQVGETSSAEANSVRDTLKGPYRERYVVASHIDVHTLSWILAHSFCVVGRAGANTVMELAALAKVAVLVPLPWSGGGEQQKNAAWIAGHGGAVVVQQDALTPKNLEQTIKEIRLNMNSLKKRASDFSRLVPHDGVQRFVDEIERMLPRT